MFACLSQGSGGENGGDLLEGRMWGKLTPTRPRDRGWGVGKVHLWWGGSRRRWFFEPGRGGVCTPVWGFVERV